MMAPIPMSELPMGKEMQNSLHLREVTVFMFRPEPRSGRGVSLAYD
jgi:hypothetical protein